MSKEKKEVIEGEKWVFGGKKNGHTVRVYKGEKGECWAYVRDLGRCFNHKYSAPAINDVCRKFKALESKTIVQRYVRIKGWKNNNGLLFWITRRGINKIRKLFPRRIWIKNEPEIWDMILATMKKIEELWRISEITGQGGKSISELQLKAGLKRSGESVHKVIDKTIVSTMEKTTDLKSKIEKKIIPATEPPEPPGLCSRCSALPPNWSYEGNPKATDGTIHKDKHCWICINCYRAHYTQVFPSGEVICYPQVLSSINGDTIPKTPRESCMKCGHKKWRYDGRYYKGNKNRINLWICVTCNYALHEEIESKDVECPRCGYDAWDFFDNGNTEGHVIKCMGCGYIDPEDPVIFNNKTIITGIDFGDPSGSKTIKAVLRKQAGEMIVKDIEAKAAVDTVDTVDTVDVGDDINLDDYNPPDAVMMRGISLITAIQDEIDKKMSKEFNKLKKDNKELQRENAKLMDALVEIRSIVDRITERDKELKKTKPYQQDMFSYPEICRSNIDTIPVSITPPESPEHVRLILTRSENSRNTFTLHGKQFERYPASHLGPPQEDCPECASNNWDFVEEVAGNRTGIICNECNFANISASKKKECD